MLNGRTLLRLVALAVVLSWTPALEAQLNRGVIEGIVTDPQGAVVPDVDVTVTAVNTNVSVSSKTNRAGYYRAVDLVPGAYRAHFASKGFSAVDISGIEVPAGGVIRVDARLRLGATRQEVEVTATPTLVETSATNASTTLSTRLVQQIPLQGRDLQQLAYLIPGVNPVLGPPGSNFGFNSQYGTFPDPTHVLGSDLSVHGGQAGDNAWYLDGNFNLVGFAENVAVNPSPDAVEEFQVITNAIAPEYGRTGGGVFNVVLKSGTNAVHGDIYEYDRNSYFNARNPFNSIDALGHIIPQNQLRYNDFGGTVGGPVVIPHLYNGKSKTFFFLSADTSILHLMGNSTFTVPTAAMRSGDFSEDPNVISGGLWNPYTTIGPNSSGEFQRTAFGTPVPGNPYGAQGCTNFAVEAGAASGASTCNFATQIPANMLDPTAMFFVNSFPLPNYLNPLSSCPLAGGGTTRICDNYLGTVGSSVDNENISLKIDEVWSAKSRYFVEWLFSPGSYNNYRVPWTGPTFPQDATGFGSNYPVDFANQVIGLGNTYTLSPTLINEFRASFTRQFMTTHPTHPFPNNITGQSQVQQTLQPLKIPVQPPYPSPNWAMSTPGGSSLSFGPTSWVDMITTAEAYTILDDVTKVLGRHTVKTGFVYRLEHSAYESGFPTVFSFQGGLVQDPNTGLGASGLAQFMMGAVPNDGSANAGLTTSPYERWNSWGFYGQDEFHITPRLTLTYGLRYDIMGMFSVRHNPFALFCLRCANPDTGLPGKMTYEGGPGWPTRGSAIGRPNYNDFAPRINFAWSPFANNSTVIRGGYDAFYTDAVNQINAPGQGAVNDPGWSDAFAWSNSFYPDQCANFSGQCVAFPLSSNVDKGSLAVPPYNPILPAPQRPKLYGLSGLDPFTPPAHDPMVQMWNFEIQRELPGGVMLSAGYVGSHGTHLAGSDWNWNYVPAAALLQYQNTVSSVVPITQVYSGNTANLLAQVYGASQLPLSVLLKPYPFYDATNKQGLHTFASFNGTSVYNGVDIKVQKRSSHGLDFLAAYTISKSVVNPMVTVASRELVDPIHWTRSGYIGGRGGALAYSGGIGASYQNPDNVKVDRSVWAYDIPQTLNVASTYQLPFGAGRAFLNRGGLLNAALGGWLLSGTFNAEAGTPLYVTGPCDTLQSWTMQIGCRVDVVGNPHFSGNRSQQQQIADWINPAAFQPSFGSDQSFWGANYNPTDPRAWLWGTEGPELPNMRSPGFWNLDASLEKEFHLTESKYFDFRWEVFNALNHQNLGSPSTSFCLPPLANGNTDRVHQPGCQFGRITDIATDPRSMEFALKFYW